MRKRRTLEELEITSPCSRTWASLDPVAGDERTRYCDDCALHVHDLSAYTRSEGERLVNGSVGRTCFRKRVGPDGVVVTRPPVPGPLRRLLAVCGQAAAWLVVLLGGGLSSCTRAAATEEAAEEPAAGGAAESAAEEPAGESESCEMETLGGLEFIGY